MKRKLVVVSAATVVIVLVSPILLVTWEHHSLASAQTFDDATELLGEPVESFKSASALEDRFGRWDFHDVANNDVTFTPDLPAVTDRVCLFYGRFGRLTEYLVYFNDAQIEQAYFVGWN